MGEHSAICSRLIRDAAKRSLTPLGLKQKGRSRVWLGDEGWWLTHVEFQASAFSIGSYLNVGCMWLWSVQDYCSFDLGYRENNGSTFASEDQFTSVAASLAEQAAGMVLKYRQLFPGIRELSDYYLKNPPVAGWPIFHAAISHGLVGRVRQAKKLFNTWGTEADDNRDWVRAGRADSFQLRELVDDREQFHKLIASRVKQTRSLIGLPELPELKFSAN